MTEAVAMARWWKDVFHDSKVTGPLYLQRAEKHLARMKDLAAQAETQYKSGLVTSADLLRAQYLALEAEQWLEEAKAGEAP